MKFDEVYARAIYNDDVFTKEFEKESDRACVILGAAMIDEALINLIKKRLINVDSSTDPLFDNVNSPLSSFSCKIDFAYRIGLISSKFCRDLHIIRRIRNEFAHNVIGCNFENQSIVSRVYELKNSGKIIDRFSEKRDEYVEGIRGDFQMILSWMIYYLWYIAEVTEDIEPADEEWGYDLHINQENIEEFAMIEECYVPDDHYQTILNMFEKEKLK